MRLNIKLNLLFLPIFLILLGIAGGNYNIFVSSLKVADTESIAENSSKKQTLLDNYKYNDQVVVSTFSIHFPTDYILLFHQIESFVPLKVFYFQQFSFFRSEFFKILFRNIISPNAP